MENDTFHFCSSSFWCFDTSPQDDLSANHSCSGYFQSPSEPDAAKIVYPTISMQSTLQSCKSKVLLRLESLFDSNALCAVQSNTKGNNIEEYTLVQSQVLFRHGARTPISLLPGIPDVRYDKRSFQTPLSHADFEYHVVDQTGSTATGFDKSPVNRRYASIELDGGMIGGQLTTVGMNQCYNLGLELRRRYINQHNLLSHEFTANDVYMRSTYIKRTLESLQGVVAGLYGAHHLRSLDTKPKFHIEYYTEESLYPNLGGCQCLKEISNHGMAHLNDTSSKRKALMERIHQIVKFTEVHGWNLIAVRDNIAARDAHGLPLPSELDHLNADIFDQASRDFAQCITGKPEDRTAGLMLSVGQFHHNLLAKMDRALKGSVTPKLSLYSSHDTMVMPVLMSLGCYNGVWPTFASSIAFELWRHNRSGRHYVKVLYNLEEVKIAGQDRAMVPYEQFRKVLAPFAIDRKQYRYMCDNTRASIETPHVEHSAHYEDPNLDISDGDTEAKAGDTPVGM